jgi:ABC-type uncharacterized transport system fused permease/ATPase subunit
MFKAYFWSKKWFKWAYCVGVMILGCLYAQVYMTVLLNKWRRNFFDMFEQIDTHTLADFWRSLWHFTWIVLCMPSLPS